MRRALNRRAFSILSAIWVVALSIPAGGQNTNQFCQDFRFLLDSRHSSFERIKGLSNEYEDVTSFMPVIFAPNSRHCSISGEIRVKYVCFWAYTSQEKATADFSGIRSAILSCVKDDGIVEDRPISSKEDDETPTLDQIIVLGPDEKTRTIVRLWETLRRGSNATARFTISMSIDYTPDYAQGRYYPTVPAKSLLPLASAEIREKWPDPEGTGEQQLTELFGPTDFISSAVENELVGKDLRGKVAVSMPENEADVRDLWRDFYNETEAADVFNVSVATLYVLKGGMVFTGKASRFPLTGSTRLRRGVSVDGTILLGIDFLRHVHDAADKDWPLARSLVFYHEAAHVLQFHRKVEIRGKDFEAQADWLAGYCLARTIAAVTAEGEVIIDEAAIQRVFRIRGFAGADTVLHDSANQRAAWVIAGARFGRDNGELEAALELSRDLAQ